MTKGRLSRRGRRQVARLIAGPVALDQLAIPAFGLAASGGDDLEAVRACLEAARHSGCDANHVPLLDLDDLVVQLDATRAVDDRVDLLLDLVAVAGRLDARLMAPPAHAELGGIEKLPREAAVDPVGPAGFDVLEILYRVVGSRASNLPRWGPGKPASRAKQACTQPPRWCPEGRPEAASASRRVP